MANEITGMSSVYSAMHTQASRQKADRPESAGKSQPVQRQELPRDTEYTSASPGMNSSAKNSAELNEVVDRINDIVQNTQRDLLFSIDEGSGRTTITVRDSQTKEVIRQIPSEEVLTMVEHLKEATSGLLFNSDI